MGPILPAVRASIRGAHALPGLLLAGALVLPAPAQAAAVTAVTARTVLVEDLSIEKSKDLDFGNIIVGPGGGNIVLVPTETPECTATGGLIRSGACQPAVFVGAGRKDRNVRIRIPPGGTMTISNGAGATMTIEDMTVDSNPDTTVVRENKRSFRLRVRSDSGLFYFRVGGTLKVAAGQAQGTYTGTFMVDAHYF